MTVFTESLLVIDSSRKFESVTVDALSSLGYRHIVHANFEEGVKPVSPYARFDAVVAHWVNDLPAHAVAAVVRSVMSYCGCEGALMISPFATVESADLFRSAGVAAWVRVPFTRRDLDARLRFVLEGERRQRRVPVLIDRRRRVGVPAFA